MARAPLGHEGRLFALALVGGAPALALALAMLARAAWPPSLRWILATLAVGAWWGAASAIRQHAARPLQTLANMVAAIREGDTSVRARADEPDSALGLAHAEMNALAEQVRRQRLDAMEATALLRRVMESIDVAVFAFDGEGRLRLVNHDGEQLLALPAERALGRTAESLGLASALAGDTPRLVELRLGGRRGRWELRRGAYRQDGRPHELLVLSDLTRALHEEERQAWMRLIRVLSHEINNSLAPIQSIAGSLRTLIERGDRLPHREADLQQGLAVIESRAQALGRFMQSYARLARLPQPVPGPVPVGEWVRRVVALETRLAVAIKPGPPVTLVADGDQLDQLLINLVRNAVDAALETGGGVRVAWMADPEGVDVTVEDDGPGVSDTANLFVPFFTTKPGGSGIGLALCRQIAEAHGGSVALANREGARGAMARVRLPAEARVAG
jgi:PAS domain S-box-containing protein